MAQWVKNPPAVQKTEETCVWSLGQEDPLEEEMATHSRILAWRIPQIGELDGLCPWGCKELDTGTIYDIKLNQNSNIGNI